MATRVEDIYSKYIRSLSIKERAELIALTSQDIETNGSEKNTRRVSELHGLGRDLWRDVDASQLVEELRDEWDG